SIEDYAYGKIMFVTHSSAIVLVLDKEDVEELDDEDDEGKAVPTAKVNTEKKSKKPKKALNPIGFSALYS
ncbi:MAG: hypothetical protein ACI4JF_01800, partial [Oscillospiraceae bacterium]